MTTEDDFQRALDARPDDWQTRLVFADWLEERNDPRAEGYRALGTLRLYPDMHYSMRFVWQNVGEWSASRNRDRSILPKDWYRPLSHSGELGLEKNESRRGADDKAALAFATLSAVRRSELLAEQPPPRTDP